MKWNKYLYQRCVECGCYKIPSANHPHPPTCDPQTLCRKSYIMLSLHAASANMTWEIILNMWHLLLRLCRPLSLFLLYTCIVIVGAFILHIVVCISDIMWADWSYRNAPNCFCIHIHMCCQIRLYNHLSIWLIKIDAMFILLAEESKIHSSPPVQNHMLQADLRRNGTSEMWTTCLGHYMIVNGREFNVQPVITVAMPKLLHYCMLVCYCGLYCRWSPAVLTNLFWRSYLEWLRC